MTSRIQILAPLALVVLGAASAARAHGQAFTGAIDVTLPNFARTADPARCGAFPANIREEWPSLAGTSTFGAFGLASSNCVDRSTGSHFNGRFTLDFGGGRTLFGTYLGQVALPLPPAVGAAAATSQTLTILGGTGTFAGAGGTVSKAGTITINANGTFTLNQSLTGTVSTVPEPTTVVLLAGGLVAIGAVARRRRAIPVRAASSLEE